MMSIGLAGWFAGAVMAASQAVTAPCCSLANLRVIIEPVARPAPPPVVATPPAAAEKQAANPAPRPVEAREAKGLSAKCVEALEAFSVGESGAAKARQSCN